MVKRDKKFMFVEFYLQVGHVAPSVCGLGLEEAAGEDFRRKTRRVLVIHLGNRSFFEIGTMG